ncbi:hypothetical protein M3I53_34935 [Paraburkholderia sp. CNPSo 3272]|uniref:hypothetical protein n=1 Tax=Paraburkholderia sp. CNPSo 3272 TaxID=2940931 RepID=UPI0020B834E6|nr:hypothetical protein [Paraburkholderia sp. CNPSo 3272]MCP3728246.1 hypothetical protein [Paraburkholderia sp. CNPSo 3272]
MMFDETPRCQRARDLGFAEFRCGVEMTHGQHDEPCAFNGAADGLHCRCCLIGCVDKRESWTASYVRTRLRMMAGDIFSVSRHTTDFASRALQDRFVSDTDAVLKRVLDLAALRYLRDGSTTVTQEDVTDALRLLLMEASRP